MSFQMFKLALEKAEEPEIKLPTCARSSKKQESSRKTSTSALLTMPKPCTVRITTNCGKFFKRWELPDHLTCFLRNLYIGQEATVRTGHETTDWFQIRKGVHQAIYCHPVCLTYMQGTACERPGWMKQKLESRFQGEISISDMQMITLYGRKRRETKEPLNECEKKSIRADLKVNIPESKIMALNPITSWQIDGETMEAVTYFIFLDSKITADGDCIHEIKRSLLLGRKVITKLDSI